jgi:UDPglucose--hexose-1-phosphate uridylyltransferase
MELRWDPILGEWVMVSNIRSFRPWQPTTFCPFCPGTEETGYGWKALIVENKYPMLTEEPPEPTKHRFYKTQKAYGKCYVVIETPLHDIDDLSDLLEEQIAYVINLIIEKQKEIMDKEFVEYFLWFRNKGREIGVSLTHPHSQIYVLPFTPIKILREMENAKNYWKENNSCIFCKIIEVEKEDGIRVLLENRVFSKPMPYIMVLHQAPLKGSHPYYHLHIEIYGFLRDEGKLKYAAGMETGGGNFTYDAVPEENASKLRAKINECVNSAK